MRVGGGSLGVDVAAERGPSFVRVTVCPSTPLPSALLYGPRFALAYRALGAGPLPPDAVVDLVARVLPTAGAAADRLAARMAMPAVAWGSSPPAPRESPPSEPPPPAASVRFAGACDLRCCFCDAHRLPSSRLRPAVEQLDALIAGGASAVLFCDGEPLGDPALPSLVRRATAAGLRVELQSSGPALADAARLQTLADAGLTGLHVPLYAPAAALHDRLVGRDGAFAATVAGIAHAREAGLRIRAAIVVLRKNLGAIGETVELLGRLSGHPAVRLTWARPPAADAARYRDLALSPAEGLPALVAAFGPGLLWRRAPLWWAPPCLCAPHGGPPPLWQATARLTYEREPHHALQDCPHAALCAYDCRLYRVLVDAFGGEGLAPVPPGASPADRTLTERTVERTDTTTVWASR